MIMDCCKIKGWIRYYEKKSKINSRILKLDYFYMLYGAIKIYAKDYSLHFSCAHPIGVIFYWTRGSSIHYVSTFSGFFGPTLPLYKQL